MDIAHILFSTFTLALSRWLFELRDERRMRRELAQLSSLGESQLRDLGLSHAAVARALRSNAALA
jgi:uncharacterized protein YjiS (DUF1127 family)